MIDLNDYKIEKYNGYELIRIFKIKKIEISLIHEFIKFLQKESVYDDFVEQFPTYSFNKKHLTQYDMVNSFEWINSINSSKNIKWYYIDYKWKKFLKSKQK